MWHTPRYALVFVVSRGYTAPWLCLNKEDTRYANGAAAIMRGMPNNISTEFAASSGAN